jgi:SAM-dependent methyltransferase
VARLNETHAMAAMRARAGRIVGGIEARRRRLVARRVRRLRPGLVVDVGCEDGWIAEAYLSAAGRVVLVDLDPEVLRRSAISRDPRVACVVADACDGEAVARALGVARADAIVLSALLEHLPDPGAALRALRPVLRRGGRFVVYLPADGPILGAKALLRLTRTGGLVRGLSTEPAPGHLHRFGRRHVARLLAPHGRIEELTFDPVCLGYLAVVRSD